MTGANTKELGTLATDAWLLWLLWLLLRLFGTRLMTVYDHMTPVLQQSLRLIYTKISMMKSSSSSRAPAALSSKNRRELPEMEHLEK